MATYNGTKNNDVYDGTADDDVIRGGQGGDTLRGHGGNDRIYGEDGNDRLEGGDGDDILDGGKGEDVLLGGTGNDELLGGIGEDQLDGGAGRDHLRGGIGNDRIEGGAGTDAAYFNGNPGDYTITTVDGVTTVRDNKPKTDGDDGTDRLTGVERLVFKDGTVIFLTPNANPSAPADSDPTANSIAEGAAAGTLVGIQANSTDADGDPVTYRLVLSDGTTALNDGRFAIDPTTGAVSVYSSAALDYETSDSHMITVRASDAFGGSSDSSFTVNVTNVAPGTPSDSDGDAGGSVSEGAANGDLVGVTGSSSDVNGGAITYSLTDNAGGRFAINATTGVVTVADASLLNFEDATSHQITVQASDGTDTSSQSFTIAVTNVAPAAPADNNAAANELAENAAVGSVVGITASSSDVNGGAIEYYFEDEDGNRVQTRGSFTVNALTGVVTLAAALDYETADSHLLTIYASDSTDESSSSFTVNVTNVAPSTPSDSNGDAGGSVSEGAANGALVGVTGSSSDVNGGAITYSLTDNAGGRFVIDATTGVVTVANASLINYESATSHQITVQASDGTDTSSQSFTIAVTNVAPSAPNDSNAAANQVAENAAVGSQVGITASSTDVNGGTVSYYFKNGDGNAVQTLGNFTVNASTGVVTVASALDYETSSSHSLTIYAGDGSGESSSNFTVAVTDVSEGFTMDFEGLSSVSNGSFYYSPYQEDGLYAIPINHHHVFHDGSGDTSIMVYDFSGEGIQLQKADGSAFDLHNLDIIQSYGTVIYTGSNGATLNYTGGAVDNYDFGTLFDDVTWITITMPNSSSGHRIDDIFWG